jgi:hypothetical protein
MKPEWSPASPQSVWGKLGEGHPCGPDGTESGQVILTVYCEEMCGVTKSSWVPEDEPVRDHGRCPRCGHKMIAGRLKWVR